MLAKNKEVVIISVGFQYKHNVNKTMNRITIWKAISHGLLVGLVCGQALYASAQSKSLPIEEIRLLNTVIDYIKESYVDDKTDKELISKAISGMVKSLDPHSSYLEPKAFDSLKTSTRGEFGGLGIEVSLDEEGFIKIISPIDDTPAQRAGLRSGDVIVRLNDQPVQGLTLQDAVEIMRGKPGTEITLTLVRTGEEKPVVETLIREVIQVRSIRTEALENNILYIRLSRFQEPTADQLIKAIKSAQASEGGVSGVILDLRNNPGGLLPTAIQVSGVFVGNKEVVSTKGRWHNQNQVFKSNTDAVFAERPVVVLINEGSASASEIVAGALQDHGRAVIMGRQSFGKGSVQTLRPLSNKGHGLKLTTARFYTPKGNAIQAKGITPDIHIPVLDVKQREGIKRIKENNLKGSLNAETTTETESLSETDESNAKTAESLVNTDYELSQAINMIKGLTWKDKATLKTK